MAANCTMKAVRSEKEKYPFCLLFFSLVCLFVFNPAWFLSFSSIRKRICEWHPTSVRHRRKESQADRQADEQILAPLIKLLVTRSSRIGSIKVSERANVRRAQKQHRHTGRQTDRQFWNEKHPSIRRQWFSGIRQKEREAQTDKQTFSTHAQIMQNSNAIKSNQIQLNCVASSLWIKEMIILFN